MDLLSLTHRLTFDIPKSSVFLRTLKSLSVCFDSQRSLLLHARNRRFVAVDSLVGLIPQTALDHVGLCSYNRPNLVAALHEILWSFGVRQDY